MFEPGHIAIVRLLLDNGASTAILCPSGILYRCTDFEGVQHTIEEHRHTHLQQVFAAISERRGLKKLKSIFLVRAIYWHYLKLI